MSVISLVFVETDLKKNCVNGLNFGIIMLFVLCDLVQGRVE